MKLTRRGKVVVVLALMLAALLLGMWWPYVWVVK